MWIARVEDEPLVYRMYAAIPNEARR